MLENTLADVAGQEQAVLRLVHRSTCEFVAFRAPCKREIDHRPACPGVILCRLFHWGGAFLPRMIRSGIDCMKRREFITLLGGAAAWPIAARAQQPAMPVIGYLTSGSANEPIVDRCGAAFRQGLALVGYVEARNVAIEFRFAEHRSDRLAALATELARRQVNVIFAGGSQEALAAKSATTTVPIVFSGASDPVAIGL